jgi:hypothetical protein
MEEGAVALGRIGDLGAIKRLSERNPQAGVLALAALDPGDPDRKKCLAELLTKHPGLLGPAMIARLKKVGTDAVPLLVDALGLEKNGLAKERILTLLGDIGATSDAALEGIVDTLEKDTNVYVQLEAIRSLERIGKGTDGVKVALLSVYNDSRFPSVQAAALSALFGFEKPIKYSNESLPDKNNVDKGKYYKIYEREFKLGSIYRIDMMSTNVDAYLYIKKGDKILAYDDDSGGNLNARLVFRPEQTEKLHVWATTYGVGEVGTYDLEIRELDKLRK